MTNVRNSEREEGQRKRVPFGARRAKLQLSDEDMKNLDKNGFTARWINDADGRIERATAGGWLFVKRDEAPSVGQGVIDEGNTDLSDKVSKVVSRGDRVIRAFLMKIKKKYYEEDQAAKEAVNAKVDQALAGGEAGAAIENKYGPGVTFEK